MKHIGILNNGVIVATAINHTDYIGENELELTEEQYSTIPIPCKLVGVEFIPCKFPVYEVEETPEVEKTDAEKIEELQKRLEEIQAEISALNK